MPNHLVPFFLFFFPQVTAPVAGDGWDTSAAPVATDGVVAPIVPSGWEAAPPAPTGWE